MEDSLTPEEQAFEGKVNDIIRLFREKTSCKSKNRDGGEKNMRGMGNMQGMMKQMQVLQTNGATQEGVNQTEYTGTSQSDLVKVTVKRKA